MARRDGYWISSLDAAERTTLIATFAGWMLDGMDGMVYTFVLPTLLVLWHISRAQAGLLSTSALLVSAGGGWLAGVAADRFGRVRVLQITIVWFAVFTFLSGFTHSFEQLLVVRGLQGLGFGGEWAVGSVLIGEKIRPMLRGRAVGTTQSGWAVGWALAALFYVIFFNTLRAAWAWRAMFWLGILPALFAVWIRRHVDEPAVFVKGRSTARRGAPWVRIFAPRLLRTTLLASLLALGGQGGYYAVTTFLPLYLNQRGLSVASTGSSMAVVIGGSFAGYLCSAHLADWMGRRPALVLFAFGSLASIVVYMMVPLNKGFTLLLGFPLGFFPSGAFSPMGSVFTELFPTALRGSGQGFCYNAGRGLGAFFPAMVGGFSARMPLGLAVAVFASFGYAVMILSALALPETRGHELEDSV